MSALYLKFLDAESSLLIRRSVSEQLDRIEREGSLRVKMNRDLSLECRTFFAMLAS